MAIHSISCTDPETCHELCTAPPAFRAPGLLTGSEAVDYAEQHGLTLSKHADPIEGARDGLSPSEAREIVKVDPSLIWVDVLAGD